MTDHHIYQLVDSRDWERVSKASFIQISEVHTNPSFS